MSDIHTLRPHRSTLFPYTTLFRSRELARHRLERRDDGLPPHADVAAELGRLRLLEGNRSEEHTSELQSLRHLVCRLLLEKKQETQCSLDVVVRRHIKPCSWRWSPH